MKRAICLLLTMILVMGTLLPQQVVAKERTTSITINDVKCFVNSIVEKDNTKELKVSDMILSIDEVTIISFSVEGIKDIKLTGDLYPFTEGLNKDKVILGEFEGVEDKYLISDFRISKLNKPIISFSVRDSNLGETYLLQASISEKEYNILNQVSKNIMESTIKDSENRMDYLDKLVQLDLGEKLSVSSGQGIQGEQQVMINGFVSEKSIAKESTKSSNVLLDDFTYTELREFIQELKSSGSSGVDISTAGISESFFTTTGWQHANEDSGTRFGASKYTSNNGGGVYYTRITMMDVKQGHDYDGSTIFDTYLSMTIKYGVMIEYVQGTNTAKLYLDNYGLKVYNVELAISELRGNTNNIFTNRNITGQVYTNNYDITGLIGLIPHTQYLTAFWGVFSTEGTNQFMAGKYDFGDTVNEQIDTYGKVVRGISMNSNTTYMRNEIDRMRIEGEIRFSRTCTWGSNYKYWVSTF